METRDYIDVIKFQLTGGVLQSEIDDAGYENIINIALKELNRYYNATRLIRVPGASCIDLSKYPEINNVVNVYREQGIGNTSDAAGDPVAMSQLQMYNFGSGRYNNAWINNYIMYSTAQRISNTMSTDLFFKEDKTDKKLYVNLPQGIPQFITIEYIPILRDASEVVSDHWIDMLTRLSLAYAKVALGRIRTRYTQDGAVWSGDGETILAEGNAELEDLREKMRSSNDYLLPID